jgi:hypothetical protein
MKTSNRRPASIVILKSKAGRVRQLAAEHGFSFKEGPVVDREDEIRFYFEAMDDATTRRLVSIIPQDAYARRAVFGAQDPRADKDSM